MNAYEVGGLRLVALVGEGGGEGLQRTARLKADATEAVGVGPRPTAGRLNFDIEGALLSLGEKQTYIGRSDLSDPVQEL